MGILSNFFNQGKAHNTVLDDVTRQRIMSEPDGISRWFLQNELAAISRKRGTEPNQIGQLLDCWEENDRNAWIADLAQQIGATPDHTLVQVGKLMEQVKKHIGVSLEVVPGPDGVKAHGRLAIASKEMLYTEVAAIKKLVSTRLANVAPIMQSVLASGVSYEEIAAEFDSRKDQQILEGCRELGRLVEAK